ncbi:hypothetical protein Bestia_00028 [Acinetobacter phage Bestia]|nr:hypothetical protein Bestia_00028 [Acinetobacter phage Bestia]
MHSYVVRMWVQLKRINMNWKIVVMIIGMLVISVIMGGFTFIGFKLFQLMWEFLF